MFLAGPFEPLNKEIFVEDLQVEGQIPEDLNGEFVRNGPNPQYPPLGLVIISSFKLFCFCLLLILLLSFILKLLMN